MQADSVGEYDHCHFFITGSHRGAEERELRGGQVACGVYDGVSEVGCKRFDHFPTLEVVGVVVSALAHDAGEIGGHGYAISSLRTSETL